MIISFDRVDLMYGENWNKHYNTISKEDNLIFWDEFHCDRFYPLKNSAKGWNELYKIYTSKFKKNVVYYVTSDFNIFSRAKELKKYIDLKNEKIYTNIEFLIHPYTMSFSEYFNLNDGSGLLIKDNEIFRKGVGYKKDYKYNFISLNGTRKDHRIKTIKNLHNHKNFVYSYYPFEDDDELDYCFDISGEKRYLNELTELNEIYDKELFEKIIDKPLREQTKDELKNKMQNKFDAFQMCVPLEYVQSCADLVTESFVGDSLSYTEKTWKPIALKKPFLLMSGKNAHKYLKVMGYELYDELFDYSFDDKDFNTRFSSIIDQVKTLCKISTKEFAEQISDEKIKSKIEYNYSHFKEQSRKWQEEFKIYQEEYICEESTDDNFLKKLNRNQFDENIFSK
tara:strand:+ start:1167 stop:2351 length:1185 start_codon:yes stop_codon:yes gene_type:complete